MEKVSDELAACRLFALDGSDVAFRTLVEGKRTLVVFVRHFGCIFCRSRLAKLRQHNRALTAADVNVVVIGNGTVPMAEAFVEETGLDVPLYTDPTRQAYREAGMRRNFGLGPRAVLQAARAYAGGQRQGKTAGDVWQQGGVLLINAEGCIDYYLADTGAGDSIDFGHLMDKIGEAS